MEMPFPLHLHHLLLCILSIYSSLIKETLSQAHHPHSGLHTLPVLVPLPGISSSLQDLSLQRHSANVSSITPSLPSLNQINSLSSPCAPLCNIFFFFGLNVSIINACLEIFFLVPDCDFETWQKSPIVIPLQPQLLASCTHQSKCSITVSWKNKVQKMYSAPQVYDVFREGRRAVYSSSDKFRLQVG